MLKLLSVIPVCAVFVLSSSPAKTLHYVADSNILNDTSLTILYLPLKSIKSEYIDNTSLKPEVEYSDSFYIEAANALVLFELSRIFKVTDQHPDSTGNKKVPQKEEYWSNLVKSETSEDTISELIAGIAKEFNSDLVAVPYSCSIKHSAVRQKGWRGGKYEGSYVRPVTYSANAQFHVQIWSKDGKLLYEKIGLGAAGRPIFYSMFKKRTPDASSPTFARKLFAPPLAKALKEAIRKSLEVR